jgi:hypothetical protein
MSSTIILERGIQIVDPMAGHAGKSARFSGRLSHSSRNGQHYHDQEVAQVGPQMLAAEGPRRVAPDCVAACQSGRTHRRPRHARQAKSAAYRGDRPTARALRANRMNQGASCGRMQNFARSISKILYGSQIRRYPILTYLALLRRHRLSTQAAVVYGAQESKRKRSPSEILCSSM